ncbi:MAG: phospholipase A [Capnocytophaga sp.]|nr:phospholipase A [Capnocytophaga sp.]
MKKITFLLAIFVVGIGYAQQEPDSLPIEVPSKYPKRNYIGTYLSRMWDLDDFDQHKTFTLSTFQPNYMLPFRWSSPFNRQPTNFNPNKGTPDYKEYQDVEMMFQVSLKSKVAQDVLGEADVWVGFTQASYWQVYNGNLSRPFREMNYEPEVMFVMPLNFSAKDFRWRMVAVSINHQSNGKEQILSRSWNRIIVTTAGEWRDFMFTFKGWWRFKEKADEDDNPQILDYMGRAEFGMIYHKGKHTFGLTHRNSLKIKDNRGFTEFNYIFPITSGLKAILQVSHGYGDSLIEYNHKQTSIGLGVVFLDF